MSSIALPVGSFHLPWTQSKNVQDATIIRWEKKSRTYAWKERVKDLAINALRTIGLLFAILGGSSSLIRQPLIKHGLNPPMWIFYASLGLFSSAGGLLILAEKLQRRRGEWVNYNNRKVALEIVNDFKEGKLEILARKYKNALPLLIRCGILPEKMGSGTEEKNIGKELQRLFTINSLKKELKQLQEEKKSLEIQPRELAISELEAIWKSDFGSGEKLRPHLPQFKEIFHA